MRWVLPDYIQDVLPDEAACLEDLRRRLLDAFRARGYQLVMPPLVEYLDALTTGAGRDLRLRTYQLVDQFSGRAMGVRADMTPQTTRIDAHLLNRPGVSRLCYCGSVLHTRPSSFTATREPLQLGAELYGHAGIEADIEVLRLLAEVMRLAEVPATRIDISHVGLFHALAECAGLNDAAREEAFRLLQGKDIPGLRGLLAATDARARDAILALPGLYGGAEVLDDAEARLPRIPEVGAALADLRRLAADLADLPLGFDLADLRGYHYHSGLMFAAYGGGAHTALALGGRYNRVAEAFGRERAATGFSLDLRKLLRCVPMAALPGAVLAPAQQDQNPALRIEISRLRAAGEIVVDALPGHEGTWKDAGCDRQLVMREGHWTVAPLHGE
ncbi:MAG: ATP phosphoribosyltransferase regulatory subunit [Azoarcus sp.]|jgi:ATP phosphoribosyltransferase regulatory subunit|nr:ATP phosphoribosyltransferase regulatory subunit [Azoarcus sp.]